MCVYIYIYIHTHVCVVIHTYIVIYLCIQKSLSLSLFLYIYIYIYIYIYSARPAPDPAAIRPRPGLLRAAAAPALPISMTIAVAFTVTITVTVTISTISTISTIRTINTDITIITILTITRESEQRREGSGGKPRQGHSRLGERKKQGGKTWNQANEQTDSCWSACARNRSSPRSLSLMPDPRFNFGHPPQSSPRPRERQLPCATSAQIGRTATQPLGASRPCAPCTRQGAHGELALRSPFGGASRVRGPLPLGGAPSVRIRLLDSFDVSSSLPFPAGLQGARPKGGGV